LLYEVGNSTKIPDIPDHLSAELKDLMLQCFKRVPVERPTAEQLLHHAWFKVDYDDDDADDVYEDDDFDEDSAPATGGGASFPSSKKRSGNLLTKSMSASRSQALQEQPKSLDALPEQILLKMLAFMNPQAVIAMARSCARFRFLAQRNTVWVALATNRWNKLRINLDAQMSLANSGSATDDGGSEVDFGKKLFMASLKYDRRFSADPMYRHVRTVKGHTKRVHAMQILEGSAKLITCAADKKIKIWEISSGSNLPNSNGSSASPSSSNNLAGSGSIAKDSSSSNLSTSGSSSSSKKKKASMTLRGHNAAVTCFYASNTTLVSGSCDGMIKVWDMKSKKCTMSIKTGDSAGITGLQTDEKLNYLVTSSSDGVAKVWDLQALTIRLTLNGHKSSINALKFHHHTLATASSDKRVNVWDLRTGTLLKSLRGHTDEILCVDIIGDTILAGSANGTLLEWTYLDRISPGPRAYLLPPSIGPSPILSIHFDGVNTVIAGREDGIVLIWKYHSGEFHSSIKVDSGPVTALTACNQVLATAGYGEKIVKLWALVNP
jgi:serine/threonine protein kinase